MNSTMWVRLTIVGLALSVPTQVRADVSLLYVSSYETNTIQTITPGGTTHTFASGLSNPYGMAFDSAGNLYVANAYGGVSGTIEKFTPGGVSSVFASTGLNIPVGLAFDASGNLYVTNSGAGSIEKFTPSGVGTMFATGLSTPYGIALDSAGNVYVGNEGSSVIDKITPGGVSSFFASAVSSLALAFDSSGNLFSANGNSTITKFTPGGAASVFATGQPLTFALAFDSSGNLFSANYYAGTITEFTPGGGGVGSFFASVSGEPVGLAFDTGLVYGPTVSTPEPSSFLIVCSVLGLTGAFLCLRRRYRSQRTCPSERTGQSDGTLLKETNS
ncbi:MAG: hypothetical protein ACHRXM_17220 [Isosphaerales bacterium]